MTYAEVLTRLIEQGIEGARGDYKRLDQAHKLEGSIQGFEACRGKEPDEIRTLLREAGQKTRAARVRVQEGESNPNDYWRARCRELEIEWIANCVSVMLVRQGIEPIVPPTVRAALAVGRVVGVKEEKP